mgnify:CR=1 FL=1
MLRVNQLAQRSTEPPGIKDIARALGISEKTASVHVSNVIRKLGTEHNLTMLMVTHQMGFAREFADRVCFFYKGQIHEQGTPAQIFEHPQQERTCAFLSAVKEAN